jgi:acyl-[acyl-carrier-protein]-phospholipid O-acyltransferase/long-chain-fatty-acid--[acyl-carrier-protein] ligase
MGLSALSALGITVVLFFIPHTVSITILGLEFILFGLFSGVLIVPLNAKIQLLSSNTHLGTILAGNNFIQTVFMFAFLMLTTLFAYYGVDATSLFYFMMIVGVYLSVKLFKRYLVMGFWAFFELLFRIRYKFNYVGVQNTECSGAIMFVGNHVSWIDWFILQLPIERRISYIIDKDIYKHKLLNWAFKLAQLIPVSQRASKNSFLETSMKLKNGKIIAIFPEGEISRSSDVSKFYRGYEFIDRNGSAIVPFYIDGVFGSIFARHKGDAKRCFLKKREITLYFGEPITKDITPEELREKVINLKC